jgi:eukaryotic-like serine/threonine-protein kinase
MPLSAGTKLGPYEILALIGAGGMGEVYRATDPRMGRDVAIKISAERFCYRFSREVHAVAALNHPNICHVYDTGPDYLVMELIEGPTLAERIKGGAIPPEESLKVARQIADALEAAHEKGIIHRDLKPGNIKLRPDGTVKVLDFGLAKVAETAAVGSSTENSPTATLDAATRVGAILGTVAYMPPEQAHGEAVDKRADIWAFGVVLYEMLTGERLFKGETVSDTLIEVATKEPRWERIPAKTQRLLRRCLEKDPKRRLRDIGDAWELLEDPLLSQGAARRHSSRAWVVAAVVTLALVALAFVYFREQSAVAELTRFQIPLPANTVPAPLAAEEVSPDGRKLAFEAADSAGVTRLFVRSFDSIDARVLPGIEAVSGVGTLFWYFDSRSIAFLSSDHKLKKVDISGGPAQTLCDAGDVGGGSWSRGGVILFSDAQRVVSRVSAAGGTPTALTALDHGGQDAGHFFPKLLPDGRHFLYFRHLRTPATSGIYVGSIDAKPSEQSTKPLLMNEYFPGYYVPSGNSSGGHLLFYRDGTVLAQPFNPNKLELSGDAAPVAEQVRSYVGFMSFFSASANGVLVYLGGNGGGGNTQLAWLDREGKNLGTVGEPGRIHTLALARNGKQAAVARFDAHSASKINLWLYDFKRGGAPMRFTFSDSSDYFPVFSPDGSSIVFGSTRDGGGNLYRKLTSGMRDEELLLKSDERQYPYDWSPDGRFLLYSAVSPKIGGRHLDSAHVPGA